MKRAIIPIAAVLLAVSPATPLTARDGGQGADPAINQPFQEPDFEHWKGVFEREGREVYDRRNDIVDALQLRPGLVVADVGAGSGLFTLLFAAEIGDTGRVLAVDIAPSFVEAIRARARSRGLRNVDGVVSTQTDVSLPPGIIDLVFLCDTYHHFEHPAAMLRSIHSALRPGGELVIVDFQRIAGKSSQWVMDHVRVGRDGVVREVEAAGFRLVDERRFLHENFFLRFERITPLAGERFPKQAGS
jgi:predicted methyltransferase